MRSRSGLLPARALDERDHAVEKALTRSSRHPDDDLVRQDASATRDGRAVAAGLADHRSRLAGDRRLVDARDSLDDVAVAGITSPAVTTTSSPTVELRARELRR